MIKLFLIVRYLASILIVFERASGLKFGFYISFFESSDK